MTSLFADYMLSTYIYEDATFPPSIWAAAPMPENAHFPRTTNACEAFHRHLKQSFKNASPNIFEFSNELRLLQEQNYVKLQSMSATRPTTTADGDKKTSLIENYTKYCQDELSRNEYLTIICHRYLPVDVHK